MIVCRRLKMSSKLPLSTTSHVLVLNCCKSQAIYVHCIALHDFSTVSLITNCVIWLASLVTDIEETSLKWLLRFLCFTDLTVDMIAQGMCKDCCCCTWRGDSPALIHASSFSLQQRPGFSCSRRGQTWKIGAKSQSRELWQLAFMRLVSFV